MTTFARWRKSSRSQATASCVELVNTLDAVRDSKNAAGPVLAAVGVGSLVVAVKDGRFDR